MNEIEKSENNLIEQTKKIFENHRVLKKQLTGHLILPLRSSKQYLIIKQFHSKLKKNIRKQLLRAKI